MLRTVQVATADHRVLDAEIGGPVLIRINGFEAVAGEVLFLPQAIDEDGFEVLIGYMESAIRSGHRVVAEILGRGTDSAGTGGGASSSGRSTLPATGRRSWLALGGAATAVALAARAARRAAPT